MWLASDQVPDHNTINRFRSLRLKDSIHNIFTHVVIMLVYLSIEVAYIDGTKIESRAYRYTLTLIPFLDAFQERYDFTLWKVVADAGYGSEKNYEFFEENQIIPYVKFNYFHKEHKRSFKRDAFHQQNLYYNAEEDY